jgi:hypothetical protein
LSFGGYHLTKRQHEATGAFWKHWVSLHQQKIGIQPELAHEDGNISVISIQTSNNITFERELHDFRHQRISVSNWFMVISLSPLGPQTRGAICWSLSLSCTRACRAWMERGQKMRSSADLRIEWNKYIGCNLKHHDQHWEI